METTSSDFIENTVDVAEAKSYTAEVEHDLMLDRSDGDRRSTGGVRRIAGAAAVATWKLQRIRRREPMSHQQGEAMRKAMQLAKPSARGSFTYNGRIVSTRPAVTAMLVELWACADGMISVPELCMVVYGRPASMRAVRQTVFRANRIMERVGCPLVICCHASSVFVRLSKRPFACYPI